MRTLNPGVVLNNKYRIENVLGEGGFGITYLATDFVLDEKVAIKEYFPSLLGTRDTTDGVTRDISIISHDDKADYDKGLIRFEEEAANLAKFNKEPGIVSVKNFFKENNTGYMVMEYIDGINLKDYLAQNGGKLPFDRVISVMNPIMESLSKIHAEGMIHRDISPDNIMVTSDNTVKLVDFGAARYFGFEDEKSLSVMLKAAYAPIEQYDSKGSQGPWTDVYALCATMYRMISGENPAESLARKSGADRLKKLQNVPAEIVSAIENGMEIDAKNRCQSIDELILLLRKKKKNTALKIAVAAMLITVLVAIGFLLITNKNDKSDVVKNQDFAESIEVSKEKEAETRGELSDAKTIEDVFVPVDMYTAGAVAIYDSANDDKNTLRLSSVGEKFSVIDETERQMVVDFDGKKAYIEKSELLSEEEYSTWKARYSDIIETIEKTVAGYNIEKIKNGEYAEACMDSYTKTLDLLEKAKSELHGVYSDFDGDGKKEAYLLISIYEEADEDSCGKRVLYAWSGSDQNTESFKALTDWANNSIGFEGREKWLLEIEFYDYLNTVIAGKNKIVCIDNPDLQYFFFYYGEECPRMFYTGGINTAWGFPCISDLAGSYIKVYDENSNTFYVKYEKERFFPFMIDKGKVKEIDSKEIPMDEYSKSDIKDAVEKYLNDKLYQIEFFDCFRRGDILTYDMIQYGDIDEGLDIVVKDYEVESVLYNTVGYYAVNIMVDCDFRNWNTKEFADTTYHIGNWGSFEVEDDYSSFIKNEGTDLLYIDKISAYVIVGVQDDTPQILDFSWGYYFDNSPRY